jgi:hypothetical protein
LVLIFRNCSKEAENASIAKNKYQNPEDIFYLGCGARSTAQERRFNCEK